ncbi:MAG: transcription elongation factor GreA [Candidatus Berkelbacteria bacterium]|nr:MAG: transcription elongation factor GreA [Candidatus Berkelbacteria bacterium]QQG52144.1 MAG: transcription elongation factor GreA [Candidatus Berkelbacteria bacterium]
MMKREILITQEGLDKLQSELKELVDVRRPDVIGRIKSAKELGDLSENAEYSSAKDEQSFIEGRIQELEDVIKHAKVVADGKGDGKTIQIGSSVTVEVEGENDKFEIVGPAESDPASGRISTDSPVGQALMGRKEKETVKVNTPDGDVAYKIVSIA